MARPGQRPTKNKTRPFCLVVEMESVDVVWLKKDLRLHDHGPLSLIAQSLSARQCIILYLYEPDQVRYSMLLKLFQHHCAEI